MDELRTLWNSTVPSYYAVVSWVLLAAAWVFLAGLWALQACMAASGQRWPAMYVHICKAVVGTATAALFFINLLAREPVVHLTLGGQVRNVTAMFVAFALFLETIWRIKEATARRARAETVRDVPYLRETL